MKKKLMLIVFIFCTFTSCFSTNDKNDTNFKNKLLGTWNPKIEDNPIAKVYVPNVSIEFYDTKETKGKENIIIASSGYIIGIISYKRVKKDNYLCKTTFDHKNIFEITIKFIDKNKIEILNDKNGFFDHEIYGKFSNLNFIDENIYVPAVKKLKFRELPSLDSKVIKMLTPDDKVELIEKGKTETINNVRGTWVKVKTEELKEGWCFNAYLTKYEPEY